MNNKFYVAIICLISFQGLMATNWVYLTQSQPKLFKTMDFSGSPSLAQKKCKSKVLNENTGKILLDCNGLQGWTLKIHTSVVPPGELPITLSESDFKKQSINRARMRLNDTSGTLASRGFLYSNTDNSNIKQSELEAESSLRWLELITNP